MSAKRNRPGRRHTRVRDARRHSTPHSGPAFEHRIGWTRERALARLESPERLQSGEAQALWEMVGLSPGETVADIGAGTGYFAFPAARIVGRRGRLWAVDVSPELIDLLEERRRSWRTPQLTVVRSRPARIPLPAHAADVVLLANLLHGIPDSTLLEAVRILRPTGRLVVVDWSKYGPGGGPPRRRRLSIAAARQRLEAAGTTVIANGRLGTNHYVLIAARADRAARGRRR